MSGSELYLSQRDLIERAITAVCRHHHLWGDDADDFAGVVRLHCVEDDYAVLRRFQGRSSLRTYLLAVITHCFQDYRNARWGKWRPSAEARRLGPLAVRLETLVVRDGLTLDEAHETLRTNFRATESRDDIERLAARFPSRHGRSFVSVEVLDACPSADGGAEAPLHSQEVGRAAREATVVLARTLSALPPEDQLILRMRFTDDCSIADIGRALHLDQKPLYRRVERLLGELRASLEAQGLGGEAVADLFAEGGFDRLAAEAPPETGGEVRRFDRRGQTSGQIVRPQ